MPLRDGGVRLLFVNQGGPAEPPHGDQSSPHGGDAERAKGAGLLFDRYVFARRERVAVEPEAGLVVAFITMDIIVKSPHIAALVHDMAHLFRLMRPEAPDAVTVLRSFQAASSI